MSKLFIVLLALLTAFVYYKKNHYTIGIGALAPDKPQQHKIWLKQEFQYSNYTITPLATFAITAQVLSKKEYSNDATSHLSPVDLALGWGPMSDPAVLGFIEVTQKHRWYKWYAASLPIPAAAISKNSANIHLIPATEEIKANIRAVQRNDIVSFSGSLVLVEGSGNWKWKSSLSRSDRGGKACEIVWVEDFYIEN